jgi:hypothetical protein
MDANAFSEMYFSSTSSCPKRYSSMFAANFPSSQTWLVDTCDLKHESHRNSTDPTMESPFSQSWEDSSAGGAKLRASWRNLTRFDLHVTTHVLRGCRLATSTVDRCLHGVSAIRALDTQVRIHRQRLQRHLDEMCKCRQFALRNGRWLCRNRKTNRRDMIHLDQTIRRPILFAAVSHSASSRLPSTRLLARDGMDCHIYVTKIPLSSSRPPFTSKGRV